MVIQLEKNVNGDFSSRGEEDSIEYVVQVVEFTAIIDC